MQKPAGVVIGSGALGCIVFAMRDRACDWLCETQLRSGTEQALETQRQRRQAMIKRCTCMLGLSF